MAVGLTRSKNLSESNLNLKTALQKLYSPGIENDIELFSLSSSVESLVLSGAISEDLRQIFRISSEQILEASGVVKKRTKFSTKYFTFTNGNEVYFTKYGLGIGSDGASKEPIYSINGSVPDIEFLDGGGGFYFTDPNDVPYDIGAPNQFEIDNVRLQGVLSGSSNCTARVTFSKVLVKGLAATYSNPAPLPATTTATITVTLPDHGLRSGNRVYVKYITGTGVDILVSSVLVINSSTFSFTGTVADANASESCEVTNAEELLRFTPFISRYTIKSLVITNPGEGYIIPETLSVLENQDVIYTDEGQVLKLVKQYGSLFANQPAVFRTKQFTYIVRGADSSGFFLYDRLNQEYVFVGRTTSPDGFSAGTETGIELKRFDGVSISNLLQFKFSQSLIYLSSYGDPYIIGGGNPASISGVINGVAAATDALQQRTQAAVQNTRRPTSADSSENSLGYRYNSFVGQDVVFWQRIVLRDQDYLLQPSASITGARLRNNVDNFLMPDVTAPEQRIRIPGLFIKVGTDYFRAFSTSDKPFFKQNYNPSLTSPQDRFALSAEDSVVPDPVQPTDWYAYSSSISELAQRITPTGTNGALYYHRDTRPSIRSISTNIGNIYAVPLFTLVG